jgi:hypothetical protein
MSAPVADERSNAKQPMSALILDAVQACEGHAIGET